MNFTKIQLQKSLAETGIRTQILVGQSSARQATKQATSPRGRTEADSCSLEVALNWSRLK